MYSQIDQLEKRILYCGTNNEDYYIIIDKIDNKYKINLSNKHVYFVNHVYDAGQDFAKYVKIMVDLLYHSIQDISTVSKGNSIVSLRDCTYKYNKFDLLYDNLMLLDKTNLEESNKILKYLKSNDLIVCKSNLLDIYIHNKLVAKCNCKKNKFILTSDILNKIEDKYKINIKLTKQLCNKIIQNKTQHQYKFHV